MKQLTLSSKENNYIGAMILLNNARAHVNVGEGEGREGREGEREFACVRTRNTEAKPGLVGRQGL